MKELCENWEMQFEVGQVTGFSEEDGRLTEVSVAGADGVTRRIPLDHLLVFFGLQPKLGPIETWGSTLERKQIVVDTARFESSIPWNIRRRGHQYLSRQEEAHFVGVPRVRAGRFCCLRLCLPGKTGVPAVHDDFA